MAKIGYFIPKSAIFHNQIFLELKISGYSLTSRLVDYQQTFVYMCSKKVAKGLPCIWVNLRNLQKKTGSHGVHDFAWIMLCSSIKSYCYNT
jgi:hypothetical protein